MTRGIYLAVVGAVVLGALIVTTGGAQVYPVRWYEDQAGQQAVTPPSSVLADGDLQFPDGTVQVTAAGSGESLGATPSPSLVLVEGGLQFSDGTVQTTAAGSLVAGTGQTTCYDSAGAVATCGTGIGLAQDGDLQLGVPWPDPRFENNGDGTVTDNLTGLIWLENADCNNGNMDWASAMAFANTLFDGSTDHAGGDCGLDDGSAAGAWRLPNERELLSLVHYGFSSPSVPNTAGTGQWVEGDPFSNVRTAFYWSSTTIAGLPGFAHTVTMFTGLGSAELKTEGIALPWPVRGGQ